MRSSGYYRYALMGELELQAGALSRAATADAAIALSGARSSKYEKNYWLKQLD